jgi:hypothetical protein
MTKLIAAFRNFVNAPKKLNRKHALLKSIIRRQWFVLLIKKCKGKVVPLQAWTDLEGG